MDGEMYITDLSGSLEYFVLNDHSDRNTMY